LKAQLQSLNGVEKQIEQEESELNEKRKKVDQHL
jgi:hypothetical protein